MSIIIIIVLIITFILADFIIRIIFKKINQAKQKREREETLQVSLKLDYTEEAKTLKRVTIENPKAKILAVDDEEIILDSFRKILVLGGFSVDTVETGKDAIGLIRKNEYDFVFTDLKMPEMDGLDVTKAVKHLRPDIDVIIITGYATIESAVDAMKHGVMDYVQKPFTEDELLDFINKCLIRRQDRIERHMKPAVHLVTPSTGESDSIHELNVPSGVFITNNHTWVRIELNGMVRIGIDDFIQKAVGKIDAVKLPSTQAVVKKDDCLFTLQQGSKNLDILSPVSGKIIDVNSEVSNLPEFINMKPYELGWICTIDPTKLSDDLCNMKIGADAVPWYKEEINKLMEMTKKIESKEEEQNVPEDEYVKSILTPKMWDTFSDTFLRNTSNSNV